MYETKFPHEDADITEKDYPFRALKVGLKAVNTSLLGILDEESDVKSCEIKYFVGCSLGASV